MLRQNVAGMCIFTLSENNKLIVRQEAGTLAVIGGQEVALRTVSGGKKIIHFIFKLSKVQHLGKCQEW